MAIKRFEVNVAYVYRVCYTVLAKTEEDAKDQVYQGKGVPHSNMAVPDYRLPPGYWKVEKIDEKR